MKTCEEESCILEHCSHGINDYNNEKRRLAGVLYWIKLLKDLQINVENININSCQFILSNKQTPSQTARNSHPDYASISHYGHQG